MKFKLLFLLLALSVQAFSHADVWTAKHQWNDEWEKKYSKWVQTDWTEDFFMRPNKPEYYLYKTDCADASYAMRLVFAYENKLPFKFKNYETGNSYISNSMKNWDKLREKKLPKKYLNEPKKVQNHILKVLTERKKLRAFMDYVADYTSTRSLKNDSYPVALKDVRPGDIYVAPGVHSYQIVNITDVGVAEVMSSTTPKAERFLDRVASFPFYVPEKVNAKSDGYRRFKQPQQLKLKSSKIPGYSTEQYTVAKSVDFDYVKFTDAMRKSLAKKHENVDDKSYRLLLALCMTANDRATYVYESLWKMQELKKKGRKCMTYNEYDNYSTPSRDRRLKKFFTSLERHWKRYRYHVPNIPAQQWVNAIFAEKANPRHLKALNEICMVQLSLGEKYFISLRDLKKNLYDGKVVSDPHAPLEYRWGLQSTPYKPSCKTY